MIELMPFAQAMGIRLIESTPTRVVGELRVRDDLCTANAILHGGAVMAFADSLGAVAAMLNLPEGAWTTTLESKTNFVGAVRAGDTARGVCEPIHVGRATMVFQTKIARGDGKLAAVVMQTQMTLAAKAG
jgi:1,4-dihydroxy-2-naphthoyl-CoA hydrolase